jgi:hypothetical protein
MLRNLQRTAIQAAALAVAAIAVVLGWVATSNIATWLPKNGYVNIAAGLFSIGLFGLAAYIYRLGKQIALVVAPPNPSDDKRAPVLYLRMFKDDFRSQAADFTSGRSIVGALVSEEERMVSVLTEFGPVVALGIPGEILPGLGAIREYVAHDVWQLHVHSYMKKAVLVVIRIGLLPPTENLLWEFREAVREVAPERIVLLVPQPHFYEAFRQLANKVEPSKPLPAYPDSALRHLTMSEKLGFKMAGGPFKEMEFMPRWLPYDWNLTGLIYFKPDGTPCFEPFRIPKGRRVNMATALRYGMKPIFQQHGVPWQDAPLNLGKLAIRIFWGSLSLFVIILIVTVAYLSSLQR